MILGLSHDRGSRWKGEVLNGKGKKEYKNIHYVRAVAVYIYCSTGNDETSCQNTRLLISAILAAASGAAAVHQLNTSNGPTWRIVVCAGRVNVSLAMQMWYPEALPKNVRKYPVRLTGSYSDRGWHQTLSADMEGRLRPGKYSR